MPSVFASCAPASLKVVGVMMSGGRTYGYVLYSLQYKKVQPISMQQLPEVIGKLVDARVENGNIRLLDMPMSALPRYTSGGKCLEKKTCYIMLATQGNQCLLFCCNTMSEGVLGLDTITKYLRDDSLFVRNLHLVNGKPTPYVKYNVAGQQEISKEKLDPFAFGAQIMNNRNQMIMTTKNKYLSNNLRVDEQYRSLFKGNDVTIDARRFIEQVVLMDINLINKAVIQSIAHYQNNKQLPDTLMRVWTHWATDIYSIVEAYAMMSPFDNKYWDAAGNVMNLATPDYIPRMFSRYVRDNDIGKSDAGVLQQYCKTYALSMRYISDLIDTVKAPVLQKLSGGKR